MIFLAIGTKVFLFLVPSGTVWDYSLVSAKVFPKN